MDLNPYEPPQVGNGNASDSQTNRILIGIIVSLFLSFLALVACFLYLAVT